MSQGRWSFQEPKHYEAIEVIDILGFELAENPRELTSSWNKTTNTWLRRYVYERYETRNETNELSERIEWSDLGTFITLL